MIFDVVVPLRNPQLGAKHCTGKFGPQFLPGIGFSITQIAEQAKSIQPFLGPGRMGRFVQQGRVIVLRL